jgi:hypothetical protein
MTELPDPPRPGMAPWMKWSLIGCGGGLALALLLMGGSFLWFWQTIGKNVTMATFDVSDKPDMPLTATVSQVLPPRVGSFVRQSAGRPTPASGIPDGVGGWEAVYAADGKRVTVVVAPTAALKATRGQRAPPGGAPRPPNPDTAVHVTMQIKPTPRDMVFWEKPNWTYMLQSPDLAALPFAKAYRPLDQ